MMAIPGNRHFSDFLSSPFTLLTQSGGIRTSLYRSVDADNLISACPVFLTVLTVAPGRNAARNYLSHLIIFRP
jgi:hypothetical protein